jgi:hypothetical protein
MPPLDPRMTDIFANSSAWQRLHEPSPDGADPFTTRIKHDVTNVLEAVMGATQALQWAVLNLQQQHLDQNTAHQKLLNDLFDDEDGAFVRMRQLIDNRFGKVIATGVLVSMSLVSAAVGYSLNN